LFRQLGLRLGLRKNPPTLALVRFLLVEKKIKKRPVANGLIDFR
jgi:hypothetical protein